MSAISWHRKIYCIVCNTFISVTHLMSSCGTALNYQVFIVYCNISAIWVCGICLNLCSQCLTACEGPRQITSAHHPPSTHSWASTIISLKRDSPLEELGCPEERLEQVWNRAWPLHDKPCIMCHCPNRIKMEVESQKCAHLWWPERQKTKWMAISSTGVQSLLFLSFGHPVYFYFFALFHLHSSF